ncbi:glycosyltransferase [Pseudoalteromonas xiamenensis]|nr:glycosyltransferase [Pseudoalteromonas xiamenensis]
MEALSLVLKVYPNAYLTLVGGGPLEERLKEQASRLGISNQVQFIEKVSHDKIPSLLGLHNVYIQPSIKDEETFQEESFGVAALEAMVSGLATVVFECGGLTELASLVNTPAVKVVPQKNVSELVKAIIYIFENKLVISHAERVKIGELFSSTMNSSQILRIYGELTQ